MSDEFELTPPPSDVKPAGSRPLTNKLYDEWMGYCETHGQGHPFTKQAHDAWKRAKEAEKRVK